MLRIALVAAVIACTSAVPPPPDRAAVDAETQAILKPLPPEPATRPISGYVAARDQQKLSLDSGGQHLVPLKVDAQTPTLRDGQKGSAMDIREGDVVRAAYKMDADGAPRALQLVVTSKPFTGRETPPGTNAEEAVAAQQAPAEQGEGDQVRPEGVPQQPAAAQSGQPPVVMEVSPVTNRDPAPPPPPAK